MDGKVLKAADIDRLWQEHADELGTYCDPRAFALAVEALVVERIDRERIDRLFKLRKSILENA